MECKYHTILEQLHEAVWERIENHYDWPLFSYWLGDDSELGSIYKEVFQEVIEEQLTEEQNMLLEKKGVNLEKMISKWCANWKENHPDFQEQKMPHSCLRVKIYEYIICQLNKADIREIIGNPC